MARLWHGRPWWHSTAIILLVALLPGTGASFAFDRNGDGIDDGGLALCLPERLEPPAIAAAGYHVAAAAAPRVDLVLHTNLAPRSPPRSPSDSR